MNSFTQSQGWVGRVDSAEGVAGRRWHQIVQPLEHQTAGVGLIGFACDAGVARNNGRVGAKRGPDALRRLLANLPVNRCTRIADAGDIVCEHDEHLESAQAQLADVVAQVLGRGVFPIVLGGGHEVAFGSWNGLAQHLSATPGDNTPAPQIGVVNIDAHLDLRLAERPSSGTPFRQIAESCKTRNWPFHYCCLGASDFANTQALFERARELSVKIVRDQDMPPTRLAETLGILDTFLADVDHVYLTLCLDALPASVAPGVSAPASCGVELSVVEAIIDRIAASLKLRLADVAELNPEFDIDHRTARVGARLVGRIAEGFSTYRQASIDE